MNAADKLDLKLRARYVLRAPLPGSVRDGGSVAAADYRNLAGVVSAFIERGVQADRAKLALLRIEGMQSTRGAAEGASLRRTEGGAARSATPPSNTGVNEGRTWLLGSGL